MRSVIVVAMAGLLTTAACSRPQPPAEDAGPPAGLVKPAVSDKLVMQGIVDPSAKLIWDAAADGVPEGANKDEAWAAVRRGAITLAESGNLLQLEGRPRDNDVWIQTAKLLTEGATAALEAAEAKNIEGLSEAGDKIYTACETCHKKHLLPAAAAAAEAAQQSAAAEKK